MKRKIIIISSIPLILIAGVFLFSFSSDIGKNENTIPEFDIIFDQEDVRAGRPSEFSVSNLTYEYNYSWDLGDGNNSYGSSITHLFQKSDYYNISLTVQKGDAKGTCTKTIVVKNLDTSHVSQEPGFRAIVPGLSRGRSVGSRIDSGITVPYVKVGVVYSGTGNIGHFFELENEVTDETIELEKETGWVIAERNEAFYILDVPNMIDRDVDYIISGGIIVIEGRVDQWEFHIEIIY